jgi:hypothetical protein
MTEAPSSIKLRRPYLSIKNATRGIDPREVMPKEPIIKPIFASSPPRLFMNKGKRKNEEKLQKKKKFAMVIKVKFFA